MGVVPGSSPYRSINFVSGPNGSRSSSSVLISTVMPFSRLSDSVRVCFIFRTARRYSRGTPGAVVSFPSAVTSK